MIPTARVPATPARAPPQTNAIELPAGSLLLARPARGQLLAARGSAGLMQLGYGAPWRSSLSGIALAIAW